MKKAFTIAELVVAVGLMAVVLAGTGYIFKVAVDAQRAAGATSEIMRNLRGITDQLNNDFAGLQADAPMAIWFQQDAGSEPNRYDQIMFFAAGDFSSYRSDYGIASPTGNDVLKGNAARIWYGQADTNDPKEKPSDIKRPSDLQRPAARILARNQHILNPNPAYTGSYDWPKIGFSGFTNPRVNGRQENEIFEYDTLSLAQWKIVKFDPDFKSTIVPNCLGDDPLPNNQRPTVTVSDPCTFNNLMCKGVGSFAVQWGYWYVDNSASPPINEWRWWPSDDPDGDKNNSDSHFGVSYMNKDFFGVYFNVDVGTATNFPNWFVPAGAVYETGAESVGLVNRSGITPKALKFTFRLYDSKGIIKNGLKFTHIVYLKQ